MSIRCGNCHHYHETIAQVRECSLGGKVTTATAVMDRPLPTTGPLASAKQLSFLRKLCDERATTLEHEANLATLTMSGASQLISEMLKRPRSKGTNTSPPVPEVPAGRYALVIDGDIKFFKVDRPEAPSPWAGRTFVKVQASDDFHPVKGSTAHRVLELIAEDPKAASLRYGQEIGACGICGRTLTDEESRARGIGPICAQKVGW